MALKILHVRASNFFGGPEKQIVEHIKEIRSSEFDLSVGSFRESSENRFLKEAQRQSIGTYEISAGFRHALSDLSSIIELGGFDIVCSHDYKSAILLHILRLRRKFKIISFVRGRTSENWRVSMYQAAEDQIVRYADGVVAVSEAEACRILSKWRWRGGAVTTPIVVHNAVRPEDSSTYSQSAEKLSLQVEFGIDASSFLFVAAGSLSPEKGHSDLVNAVLRLEEVSNTPRFNVVICGDGIGRAALAELIQSGSLQDKVHLLGHRTDLPRFLKAMDCLVLPSKSEGLPNILLETMAYGKPSLCTRVGGIPELVSHGEESILVNPDVEGIAEGMRSILFREHNLNLLGERARETVARQFTFGAQSEKLAKLYRSVYELS